LRIRILVTRKYIHEKEKKRGRKSPPVPKERKKGRPTRAYPITSISTMPVYRRGGSLQNARRIREKRN